MRNKDEAAANAREAAAFRKQQKDEDNRMKAQVDALEMKARYWKAQYEIRYYTLEAEAIQESYNEYLQKMEEARQEAEKRFEESLKELKEKGAEVKVEEGVVEA